MDYRRDLHPYESEGFCGGSSYLLLAAALDALGFKHLQPQKARRLSELLAVRKARSLSSDEIAELNALMAEADALESESLEHLATTIRR
jgi:hypothetical protein